ncbi:acyl-CoA N-acyltransferase [Clohesyomyces aquaticus]|uniref:Acyl-CoA N-acyltransferase n=1 Tax=Clohesyomyces aquaticus TaxID=1231657 RepID=A0A1Y2A296_9PLEO|nr:acyl-CoA N-acyltransferase [Clohesyomyces aquaticus]
MQKATKMAQPFVRQYNPDTDYESMLEVFHECIGDNLKFEPAWTISAYCWCIPYLLLSPSTCFVLDDSNGKAVGYILGVPDTTVFIKRWRQYYIPKLDEAKMPRPDIADDDDEAWALNWEDDPVGSLLKVLWGPERVMGLKGVDELIRNHSGHLHIDILPDFQRRGYGGKLMTALLIKLQDLNAIGCHIVLPAANTDACRFYGRYGFHVYEGSMNDGGTGEPGMLKDGSICLVQKF